MRTTVQAKDREIKFFVYSAMCFAVFEVLSIELNDYFTLVQIFERQFLFNPSVIFFCLGFFIIDMVTEIFDSKYADFFIYGKLISQILLILCGIFGVNMANIENTEVGKMFYVGPRILVNAMLASLVGYKITSHIMQKLKLRYKGNFLFARYLSSTVPGEIIFSLVFTTLNFSSGRSFHETVNIFIGLVAVKFILSFIFSLFVVPVTTLVKLYLGHLGNNIRSVPFVVD